MEWSDIWKIVVTAIMSLGGVGVVIYGIIKFSADKIAEGLSKKYELKLAKNLEFYKSELETKNHIIKTKFDKEFIIYGEISEALLFAMDACFWLFPTCLDKGFSNSDEAEIFYNKRYSAAHECVVKLQNILGVKAPFISEELYDDFLEIKKLLNIQVNMYDFCGPLQRDKPNFDKTKANAQLEAYTRADEITSKHKDIVFKMRNYLNSLENFD